MEVKFEEILHTNLNLRCLAGVYSLSLCPQAYRLEPLVNSLYAQVKPVKLDSASSKSSKDMVDLAQGPREEKTPPPLSKGWSFNPFSSSSSSKKAEPPPKTKVPDSVSGALLSLLVAKSFPV